MVHPPIAYVYLRVDRSAHHYDSSLEIQILLEQRLRNIEERDIRECRRDARLDIFVAHNKHALLVTRN
jgi:hypothetical protein